MKIRSKVNEPMFDPILAEVYRIRDAYARKFHFDTDAICDALLAGRIQHPPKQTIRRAGNRARLP